MKSIKCRKCNLEKGIDLFHRKLNGRFGRSAQCKECILKYKHKLYLKKQRSRHKEIEILNDNEFVMSEKQILIIWKEIE